MVFLTKYSSAASGMSKRMTVFLEISASSITAYLMGLLMVDIHIDISGEKDLIAGYYCSLLSSFFSMTGIFRLLVPIGLSGLCLIALLWLERHHSSSNTYWLVTCLLLFVGVPSVAVSIISCQSGCSNGFSEDLIELVKTSHFVMLFLFMYCLLCQACVLWKRLKV
jgi:hypothetical protein